MVVNIIDATNLERNLYLTTQLIDMNIRVVVALNMFDELLKNHDRLDYPGLGKMLGIPFIPTIGAKGRGIHILFRKVEEVYAGRDGSNRKIRINYGFEVERSLSVITKKIRTIAGQEEVDGISARVIALGLLARDRHIEETVLPLGR